MTKETKHIYQFCGFRLDSVERTLQRDGQSIGLTIKAFDILLVLVRNSGHVMGKDELMNAVWPETAVEESNLSQNIYVLRKTLGQLVNGQDFIETVPRLGYRFVPPVTEVQQGGADLVLERHTSSEIVVEQVEEQQPEAADRSDPQELAGRSGDRQGRRKRTWMVAAAAVVSVFAAIIVVRWFMAPKEVMSIAILPFTNATGDAGPDYYSEGIAEDVIDDLSRLASVRVMARSTAFHFSDKDDPRQIGKALNVAAVLTGRITREKDMLVLKSELVDVSDGKQIWGKRYRSSSDGIARLHDELARDLADKFRWGPAPGVQGHSINPETYELYLKSKFYYSKRIPEDMKKGLAYGEQAIAKDPDFAAAHAFLASAYILSGCSGEECREAERLAERHAERALQLDASQGRPHTVLAILRTFRSEWTEAEREFLKGIELSLREGFGHGPYAFFFLVPHGRYEEAVRELRKGLEVDPYEPVVNANLAWALFCAGKQDEAVQVVEKALKVNPGVPVLYRRLRDMYAFQGRYDEAAAIAMKQEPDKRFPPGRLDAATYWQTRLEFSSGDMISQAYAYAMLGKKDDALANLEKKFSQDQGRLAQFIRSPFLNTIRSESRYAELMKKIDLPM